MYHLVKEKGLTLEGARQSLKSKKDDEVKRVETLEKLKEIRRELLLLEEEFDRLHEQQKYSNSEIE